MAVGRITVAMSCTPWLQRQTLLTPSITVSLRNLRPSWIRSSMKSSDQTGSAQLGCSLIQGPSLSQRRPRLGLAAVDQRHRGLEI